MEGYDFIYVLQYTNSLSPASLQLHIRIFSNEYLIKKHIYSKLNECNKIFNSHFNELQKERAVLGSIFFS